MANGLNKFTSSKAIAVSPAIQLAPGDVLARKTERTKFSAKSFWPEFPNSGTGLEGVFSEMVPGFLLREPGVCSASRYHWEPGNGALIQPLLVSPSETAPR